MADPSTEMERLNLMWNQLDEYLIKIFKMESSITRREMMQFFSIVYNYCSHKSFEEARESALHLYTHLMKYLESHSREILNGMLHLITDDEKLLSTYIESWRRYEASSDKLDHCCLYLNRVFSKLAECYNELNDVHRIYRMAILTFKTIVLEVLYRPLIDAISKSIKSDQNGELIDRSRICEIMKSIAKINLMDDNRLGEEDVIMSYVFGVQGAEFYKRNVEDLF